MFRWQLNLCCRAVYLCVESLIFSSLSEMKKNQYGVSCCNHRVELAGHIRRFRYREVYIKDHLMSLNRFIELLVCY